MDKDNKNNTENTVLNNVFYNKPLYTYLFKKVTKLCEAVYAVTDLIKDSEPLKRSLRNYTLNAMTLINFTKDTGASFKGLCSELLTLQNLLAVAKKHDLIGSMNYSILEGELNSIIILLNQEIVASSTLSPDFLYVAMPEPIKDISLYQPQRAPSHNSEGVFYKGQYKRHDSGKLSEMSFKNTEIKPVYQKDNNSQNLKINKVNRRQQILDIIKTKDSLTIKDITLIIKDCSEKTIQRELVQMLSLGLLKKTGERRWSRYSIVS